MTAVLRWSQVGMGLVVAVLLTQGCGGNDKTGNRSGATSRSGPGSVVPYRYIPVTTAPALPDNAPIRSVTAEMHADRDSVRRGEVIRFVVTLNNPGPESVTFDSCPAYFMSFGESSESTGPEGSSATEPQFSLLNCDEADPIPPAGSQGFAMEFDLPDSFEMSGDGSIYWRLEGIADASSGPIAVAH